MDASGAGGNAKIAPLALVAPWVTLGKDVVIDPWAILGQQPSHSKALARQTEEYQTLHIGDRTEISPYTIIYGGAVIGEDCLIGDHASIRENSKIGNRCVIGRAVHISHDVEIGDDVKIMDHSLMAGFTKIGKNTFIGVGVIVSNDRHVDPLNYKFTKAEAPTIGEFVMIGSGANILAGITIGDRAVIASGALVVKDVPADARVMGPTARQL